MNILTLIPLRNKLLFSLFHNTAEKIIKNGIFNNFRGDKSPATVMCIENIIQDKNIILDLAVIKVPYGGELFTEPVMFNQKILKMLTEKIPFAPLPLPAIIELAKALEQTFKQTQIILIFETSFFVDLPENERFYAIPRNLKDAYKLRRFGYHGLFHQNSMQQAATLGKQEKIISICLEPRPEIAAINDGQVVFVTGGATPLEGLPGETTSGEIDPFIITTIAKKLIWGPEQINRMLCSNSGIYGITGKYQNLNNIFTAEDAKSILAKNIMQYKILLACGAAIASMGGCDCIIFSGIYYELSQKLIKYLKAKLYIHNSELIKYLVVKDSIEQIMVQQSTKFTKKSYGRNTAKYRCDNISNSLDDQFCV